MFIQSCASGAVCFHSLLHDFSQNIRFPKTVNPQNDRNERKNDLWYRSYPTVITMTYNHMPLHISAAFCS